MARPRVTLIDVVETAYRSARGNPQAWAAEVLGAARPLLDVGGGVAAYEYDTSKPMAQWLSQPIGDPELVDAIVAGFPVTPPALNERVHRRAGPVTILSELLPAPPTASPGIGPAWKEVAMADMFGVNASDPSGRGTYFCALSPRPLRREEAAIARWHHVAAHIAAAGRLRTVLARAARPDAVLAPDGRVVHAERAAQGMLPALQRAARVSERARGHRADPDELSAWRALIEGRWSLVDEIEADGRRILLAHANAPELVDPRRLTGMERVVAGYVAMGHTNKLIAYELGLTVSTVARHLHAVVRKLGVRNRVEVVDRIHLLTAGDAREVDLDGEKVIAVASPAPAPCEELLTAAELSVARLAARGQSSARIAAARGVSERTIANQLASVFRKLSIRSRSELVRRLA